MKKLILLFILFTTAIQGNAENGYDLWLRYYRLSDVSRVRNYQSLLRQLIFPVNSPTLEKAYIELDTALRGLLGSTPAASKIQAQSNALMIGTPASLPLISTYYSSDEINALGREGYFIRSWKRNGRFVITIAAREDIGILYGVFHFIRLLQTCQPIHNLNIRETPKIIDRILDHWDNLNGTIERGYAGYSLWNWQRLPGYIDKRYIDYARANASIGINGTVLNNVNASAKSLTKEYLIKAAALAQVFRPYGIKVYLTAKFSAPKEIGGLKTADPNDPEVIKWWKEKTDEVYKYIPDFGGYLVKANSEGQPGPQDYHRTHADGANMLAHALKPHGGIVMWRAFVYENRKGEDRAKQAYEEFKPLDGSFDDNVFLQIKNGPIDFQPREPFHPLFGAMPKTPQMIEFQITQEYFGFATHLVYLAPLFAETLSADTYSHGEGSTVAKIVEGKSENHTLSGMAGVANIGSDMNWCGHPFAQSNWYAFGRMAWDPAQTPKEIALDWLKMTFTHDKTFIDPVLNYMLFSREIAISYMMPLGLNHIMNLGTHYGPGPWDKIPGWDALDYHCADSLGIGFDRTMKGSNYVSQYFPAVGNRFNDLNSCPKELLLWFHHISWSREISGKPLWTSLVEAYYAGVDSVKKMQSTWEKLKGRIDDERFQQVKQLLGQQVKEAVWWRDGCVSYFQQYAKLLLPSHLSPLPILLNITGTWSFHLLSRW